VIASANQIQDSDYKASALSAIAEAIGKLNQPQKAAPLLETSDRLCQPVSGFRDKAYALRAIAEAIGKLNQPQKAAPLLEKAIASANQFQDSGEKPIP
jgi:HEAT repeat protein